MLLRTLVVNIWTFASRWWRAYHERDQVTVLIWPVVLRALPRGSTKTQQAVFGQICCEVVMSQPPENNRAVYGVVERLA